MLGLPLAPCCEFPDEAPNRVGLFVFDDGSWVVMNFNYGPAKVRINGEAHEVPARQWLCHWTGR